MDIVQLTDAIDAPVAEVWAVISGFGNNKSWMTVVKSCALEGWGIGSVRTVDAGAGKVRERLDECDPKAYRISYTMVQPSPLPVKNPRSSMQLRADGPNRTVLTWTLHADSREGASDAFVERVNMLYRTGLEGIRKMVA
jgi:hypothetical protein